MNLLKNEISPYLLGHASNPVNWYPWSETPFLIAKEKNIPIFLSIGYSACHWCHVMERESFINLDTADFLNKNFVSIKVDREERPDVDKIYMDALLSMSGSGGWPMSMFITPGGKPFYGGTYFPPQSRYGLPGFKEVLVSVKNAWDENKVGLFDQANKITNHLNRSLADKSSNSGLSDISFKQISKQYLDNYDTRFGGWGVKPKFPHPLALDLLILHNEDQNNEIGQLITQTLRHMAKGGFHDILRGGFHRYSTDQVWLVPHFEKMLYDNALLAKTYLFAGLTGSDTTFLKISESTLNFIKSELLDPSGGFWSSLDADSEGEEGLYYLWTFDELSTCFADSQWNKFTQNFDISESGNFEGRIILRYVENFNDLFDLQNLRDIQNGKVRPQTDNKVLLDWNALTLSAFAIAGKYSSNNEYIKIAEKNAEFIETQMYISGRLYHIWKNGQLKQKAFLSDYAFLINGLYDLFFSNFNIRWLNFANKLIDEMINLFWYDDQFFDTGFDQNDLIIRPQSIEDNVVPSGWSAAIQAIQTFSFITGNLKYSEIVIKSIKYIKPIISKYPFSYPNWINTILNSEQLNDYVVIIKHRNDLENANKMESLCQKLVHPKIIFVTVPANNLNIENIDFLKDKKSINNCSTVFICKNGVCSKPIIDFHELEKYLKNDFVTHLEI